VIFCKDLSFYDICFKGDALQIVRDYATDVPNMSRYVHLVEGIKSGMRYFRTASLGHIKGEANSAAHDLARETVTHIVDKIWME
jgi:hypothetical protein